MKASLLALGLYRSSGGPSKSVMAFQRALAADVVSWVDPRHLAREPQVWDDAACRCHVVASSTAPVLRQLCYPQTRGLAEAERIVAASDVVSVHSFWRWHNIWIERIAATHGVPYWFVPHGALDPYVLDKDRLVKKVFLSLGGRRFLEHAAAVICATRREHQKLVTLMPTAKPFVLPWPLADADFRDRNPALRSKVRERLGIPQDSVVLLYFGRLHPMKRPLETIDAFAEGAPPSAHLLIVGNECGVSRQACLEAARSRGVSHRVHVPGPAYGEERAACLDAADVYVSLSHRENFNFTAAEALASGLPVILSPGNDLGPELESVGCGWLMTSVDQAAETMASVATHSAADLLAMGRCGRAWAESHLRYDVFATRLREFALSLASAR